jgi:uncharacterized SAM-binding protein YcdF (DUF218 family)
MRRACQVLGVVGISLFVLSAFTPLPNLLSCWLGTSQRLEKADALVVLAAGMQSKGVLNDASLRRAVQGIVLERKGLAALLVFSGSPINGGHPTEAEVRTALARDLGVSPRAILTDVGAHTTREEAIRLADLLKPRGVHRILLVTDSQHMVRALPLFERAGFDVLPATADDVSEAVESPEGRLRLVRNVLQEFFARVYYRSAGYL